MNGDIHLLLGEIKGKLDMVVDGQERLGEKFDGLSTRISKVETRAAGHGMVTGAVAAVSIAFIKEKLGI